MTAISLHATSMRADYIRTHVRTAVQRTSTLPSLDSTAAVVSHPRAMESACLGCITLLEHHPSNVCGGSTSSCAIVRAKRTGHVVQREEMLAVSYTPQAERPPSIALCQGIPSKDNAAQRGVGLPSSQRSTTITVTADRSNHDICLRRRSSTCPFRHGKDVEWHLKVTPGHWPRGTTPPRVILNVSTSGSWLGSGVEALECSQLFCRAGPTLWLR
eukprot:COSAG02_NODE_520_length_20751_cov_17.817112_13_plen_215_part_00